MGFIQISDTHLVPGDGRLFGMCPRDRLARGVALINADHGDADFIVVTGDLAHNGDVAAYETLRDVLADSAVPVHLMMGNHDSRAPFAAVFPQASRMDGGFHQFALDSGPLRVLCLDSLSDVPGDHIGRLCDARLRWLDAEIAATPADRRLVVASHHPPFDLGLPALDRIGFADSAALWEVLQRRRPDLMLFGHVHRPVCGAWRGVPFHIMRGFNHQVGLDFSGADGLWWVEEPPDIAIVMAVGDSVVVHTRSVGGEGRRLTVE